MARLNKKKVKEKIDHYKGNLTAVARHFNVARNTVYNFLEKHPELKADLQDARESMLDNAESVLYNKVVNGDTTALIFFLKTQGKSRGYSERHEVTNVNIDYSNLTDEQLERIANGESASDVVSGN